MNAKSLFSLALLATALVVGLLSAQGLNSDARAEPVQEGSTSKGQTTEGQPSTNKLAVAPENTEEQKLETATFGAGCFWCVEAVFQKLKGVESVTSGYMGGHTDNPTYKQICTGTTGHAEIIQIEFDPTVIEFKDLLQVFWKTHDPTTLNRQGNDTGTQYRSVVFYHNDTQKELAEKYKAKLDELGAYRAPIVTEITAATKFYPAEGYHQNFWNTQGQGSGYCQAVIPPKLEKLKAAFADKLKE